MPDFVGGDPESNASECPAVFVDPETGDFLSGVGPSPTRRSSPLCDHLDVVRAAVVRGVRIRRARVVSEPLSDYLRWEHACTDVNVSAGGTSAGCPVPRLPTCCFPAPTARCSTTGWCGGTSSAAMARTRVTTPSAQIPAPFATSWRRSRWHGTGRHRTRSTRPIRTRTADRRVAGWSAGGGIPATLAACRASRRGH